jgi:HEAT repeat protein
LVEALRDALPHVRSGAAQTLGQLGPEAREAVPALTTAALHDEDLHVRVEAGIAIWRIDKRAGRVLPVLAEALQSDDEVLRWTAAECLGEMGPDARDAVPALLEALRANYKARLIRAGIQMALERIDPLAARRANGGGA